MRSGNRTNPIAYYGGALGLVLSLAMSAAAPSVRAPQHVFEPVAVSESMLSMPHNLILSADGRHLLVADLGNPVVRVVDAYPRRHC